MKRGDRTPPEQAKALSDKTNILRAAYYNFYTDKRWGHSSSYHLTVDSASLPMKNLADFIAGYVRTFISNRN